MPAAPKTSATGHRTALRRSRGISAPSEDSATTANEVGIAICKGCPTP